MGGGPPEARAEHPAQPHLQRTMLAGIIAGWARFAISFVAGFIQMRLLLRHLSDAEAGTWFVIMNALGYMMLLDFGLGVTIARHVAFVLGNKLPSGWEAGEGRGVPESRELALADLLATVGKAFRMGAGILVLAYAGIGLAMLPRITGVATFHLVSTWALATLAGALGLLGVVPSAALFGANALHLQQAAAASLRVLGLLMMFVVLELELGTPGLALALALQNLAALLVNWRLVYRLLPFLKLKLGRPQRSLARQMIGPSIQMGLVNLGGALILQTDNIIVSWRMGPAAVPSYSVGFQLAYTLLSLTLVISGPAVALSAKAHAERSVEQLKYLLGLNLRLGLSFVVVGAAMLGVLGRDLITVWVGPQRFLGTLTLVLMLVVMALEAHTTIHLRIITATARIPFVPWFVAAATINLVASYFFAGWWGWPGVISGTLVAQTLTNYWYVPRYTHRHLSISWAEYRSWLSPMAGLFAVVAGLGWITSRELSGLSSPWARLIAGGAEIGLGGATWFYFKVMQADERARLRAGFFGWLGVAT